MALRGLTKEQEQKPRQLIRDVRTVGQRIHDFFEEPRNTAATMIVMLASVFVFPALADFIFILAVCLLVYSFTRDTILPFRLPMRSNLYDFNDLLPGTKKPKKAGGICFYGNEIGSNEELWFNNDDMRTHTLIFGSTGSGKTELLISLAYNALIQGSGFIYVDGKGDNTLFSKIFSLTRSVGREDDLLVINFMTGARDIVGAQEKRLSNTLNPFSTGSSSMLSQLIVSLMSTSTSSPDGDMWKGRAISFVEALMKILVYMRDQGKILLDANAIRNYFELERLEAIVVDKIFPRDNDEAVSLASAPSIILEPLYNYVVNLPGYNKAKKGQQVSQVYEQHGFITMQLVRVFSSLADTYGHILRTNLAEVDLRDVVLNRRILVVLLPALEKSPDELANLGKVIIASLKAMMASGLGEDVEGDYRDVILRKPTNAPTPFMCILDEYGYYAVPGFAIVPAQARSLGFSVIFAGQDLPALQKASKEEAATIGANTNIKIAMKLEDPVETWDFFAKTAGEAYVTKVDAFQMDTDSLTGTYRDARSSSSERRARIDLLDLKDQVEGDMHIFFKSRIIRARTFYANPKPVPHLRINQLLKVEPPLTRMLLAFERRMQRFRELLETDDLRFGAPEFNQDIHLVSEAIKNDTSPTFIERGVAALLAYHTQTVEGPAIEETPEIAEEKVDELDIFSRVKLSDLTQQLVGSQYLAAFSSPLLQKQLTTQKVGFAERLFGQSEQKANDIAQELIRDMQLATNYPPVIREKPVVAELVVLINELSDTLEGMK